MRQSTILVLVLAACSKAPAGKSPPAPASTRPAPKPAPAPAPAKPLALAMWASQDAGAIAATVLQGPFASLDDACKSVKQPTADGFCKHDTLDDAPVLAAPFLAVEQLETTNPDDAKPDDGNDDTAHWPVVSAAVRTQAGWYVATGLCFSANHTTCELRASMVGDRLVIAYDSSEATEGRWGSEDESGLIACANGAGGLACTPKVALARKTSSTEDRDDPGGEQDVELACSGELQPDGHLVVGGKGACAKLAYFGDHAVAF